MAKTKIGKGGVKLFYYERQYKSAAGWGAHFDKQPETIRKYVQKHGSIAKWQAYVAKPKKRFNYANKNNNAAVARPCSAIGFRSIHTLWIISIHRGLAYCPTVKRHLESPIQCTECRKDCQFSGLLKLREEVEQHDKTNAFLLGLVNDNAGGDYVKAGG